MKPDVSKRVLSGDLVSASRFEPPVLVRYGQSNTTKSTSEIADINVEFGEGSDRPHLRFARNLLLSILTPAHHYRFTVELLGCRKRAVGNCQHHESCQPPAAASRYLSEIKHVRDLSIPWQYNYALAIQALGSRHFNNADRA